MNTTKGDTMTSNATDRVELLTRLRAEVDRLSTDILDVAGNNRLADDFADDFQRVQAEIGYLHTQVDMAVDEAEAELREEGAA